MRAQLPKFTSSPSGHSYQWAIISSPSCQRGSLSLAAATTSFGNEPTDIGAVGTSADDASRQCTAIALLLSDVYSRAAVLALPVPPLSHTYLIKLLSLTAGTRSAETDCIEVHRSEHNPELADGAADGAADCAANGGQPRFFHLFSLFIFPLLGLGFRVRV